MPAVAFDLTGFRATYPEFASVSDALLQAYFLQAGIYLNNGDGSPVCNLPLRSMLLNMLVAHLSALFATVNGQAPSPLVGRISSASEGSVSVSVDMGTTSPNAAWYLQTKYGANYWQATAAFRTARYIPGRSVAPRYLGGGYGRTPWRL